MENLLSICHSEGAETNQERGHAPFLTAAIVA